MAQSARTPNCRKKTSWLWLGLAAAFLSAPEAPRAEQDATPTPPEPPLVLLIQPTQEQETTRRTFQPLADYLAQAIGARITIVTRPNFLAHWETVRRNSGYDLALDDAHFTDYRIQKFGFHVLAKLPGTTSYSLIVPRGKRVSDPVELAGKKVASFGPPSIGATRVTAMFPNPSRRPALVEIVTAAEGIELLLQGKVSAAMLPSSVVGERAQRGEVTVIMTTEPTPNMALSASARLDVTRREKIRAALLQARRSEAGRQALQQVGIDHFDVATSVNYSNQSRILKDYWGY